MCCIVRDDCTYAIRVVKSLRGYRDKSHEILLEGSPVSLVGHHLDCKSVKQTNQSSWLLDYDILRLQITNFIENHGTSSAAICVMSWTATSDIFPQASRLHAPTTGDPIDLPSDQVVTTFPSFSMATNLTSSLFQLDGRLSWYGSFMPQCLFCLIRQLRRSISKRWSALIKNVRHNVFLVNFAFL